MKIKLIANPSAGSQKLQKKWLHEISPFLKEKLPPFDFEFTREKHHATEIARESIKHGYNMIVAMGGDGTLNEVLNGFFEKGEMINPEAGLGILPFGSGGDFIRSLNFERTYKKAYEHLLSPHFTPIDVVVAKFDTPEIPDRYFINISETGLGASIMKRVNAKNRMIPSLLRYVSGSFQGFKDYKNIPIEITLDDNEHLDVNITNLIIANGQYFGRGMRPAPDAVLDDGVLDIVVIKDMSWSKFIICFPELYTKKKRVSKNVFKRYRAKSIRVRCKNDKDILETEVDGELCGSGSVAFSILPKALNIKI